MKSGAPISRRRIRRQKSFRDYQELLQESELDAVDNLSAEFSSFSRVAGGAGSGQTCFLREAADDERGGNESVAGGRERNAGSFIFLAGNFVSRRQCARPKNSFGKDGSGKFIMRKRRGFARAEFRKGIGGWFTEKKRWGGGALIDIGVHALDSVWYLMGTPRPVSVSAQVYRNFAQLVRDPVFDVEDAAFAFIRFENEAVVHLETSWAGNLPDDIPQGQVFGRELNNSIVYGTKGTLRLKPLTLFEDQERHARDRADRIAG